MKLYFSDMEAIKYSIQKNCYIVDDTLLYVDLIDNISLTKKPPLEDITQIKDNEILKIPIKVKKLDFQIVSHIKKTEWDSNCFVNDIGPPKLVKIIPAPLFEHYHYLKKVEFEKGSKLTEIGDFHFQAHELSK
mgnify:CR=1 FL=1